MKSCRVNSKMLPKDLKICILATTFAFLFALGRGDRIVAKAVIYNYNNPVQPVKMGTVTFTQDTNSDTHSVQISGVVNTPETSPFAVQRGFHVHDLGNLEDGCRSAQGHFNPHNDNHGAPDDDVRHVGDLGNVEQNANNAAIYVQKSDSVISLNGPYSIIGRALVIHQGTDDFGQGGTAESLKTGSAGARIGCGVIGIASTDYTSGSNIPTTFSTIIIIFVGILQLL